MIGVTMARRILLIEDNGITRKVLRIAFRLKGDELLEAEDGRTAIQALATEPVDLIIQDLVLPDMDADLLVRRIRSLPGCQGTPILAFSAFTSQLDAVRGMHTAFAGFVQKPVEPSRLLAMVDGILRKESGAGPAAAAAGGTQL